MYCAHLITYVSLANYEVYFHHEDTQVRYIRMILLYKYTDLQNVRIHAYILLIYFLPEYNILEQLYSCLCIKMV